MAGEYYRGLSREHIKTAAEEGSLRGSPIDEDEKFLEMGVEMNVYGKDRAVWITDSRECAQVYGMGGGYFEIDTSELKVVEDSSSCYAVVMQEDLSLDHINAINLEKTEEPRDHLLEVAELLGEEYGDIELSTYEPPNFEI